MSAAEAIQVLKIICGKFGLTGKPFEAIKTAIAALEKEIK